MVESIFGSSNKSKLSPLDMLDFYVIDQRSRALCKPRILSGGRRALFAPVKLAAAYHSLLGARRRPCRVPS